ncbi:NAD(P)H-dependent amine dehydrogenase family protein [Nocardia vaccinii]|uniref:NAD(P)H-dependent amine dehydrogenase family protein n=1 Tax=Nocardia vaccinii TaxID=1822 RepID=UPI000836C6A0|nr:dihydrodipicolinate reductase [Nocardia vaccinii]
MEPNTLLDHTSHRDPDKPRYRVVQWATGTIGTRALRGVIEHPDLELVGLLVHSPDKAGRDAGELCGLPPTGVLATDDIERIIDLDADCVLYMPLIFDGDTVVRLLTAGANVVTTCGAFHHPASMDPALRHQVQHACGLGRSSVHSTGSSPGFISEAVPLVLSSIQRRLDRLAIDEYADLSRRDSAAMLFDIMGFGRPPTEFDPARAEYLAASFGPSLRLVGDALGLPVDSLTAHGEVATARETFTIAAGTIEQGTVAAQRTTITGLVGGRPLLSFRATWYCGKDIEPAWDLHDTGWHISVEGDAPLEVTLHFPVPLERMAEISPAYTANRAVNAVPAVCAAEPGIRTTLDLPHIITTLG